MNKKILINCYFYYIYIDFSEYLKYIYSNNFNKYSYTKYVSK